MARAGGPPQYLKHEQEQDLVRRARAGDRSALQEFVTASQPLVGWVWKRRFRHYRRVARDDLMQEGNIGLLRAIQEWDPDRGIRFMTYAEHWIYAKMGRFLIANELGDIAIPLSGPTAKVFWRLRAALDKLGRDASDLQLAEALGTKEHYVRHIRERMHPMRSLDGWAHGPHGASDTGRTLGEVIGDDADSPEQTVADGEEEAYRAGQFRRMVRMLEPRERFIVEERWLKERSLQEISRLLGLSRERARQIEIRAMGKLRKWSTKPL